MFPVSLLNATSDRHDRDDSTMAPPDSSAVDNRIGRTYVAATRAKRTVSRNREHLLSFHALGVCSWAYLRCGERQFNLWRRWAAGSNARYIIKNYSRVNDCLCFITLTVRDNGGTEKWGLTT